MANLPQRTFVRIAAKTSWATVKVGLVDKFLRGCNVRLNALGPEHRFIAQMAKYGKFPLLESRQINKFEKRYREWRETKTKQLTNEA